MRQAYDYWQDQPGSAHLFQRQPTRKSRQHGTNPAARRDELVTVYRRHEDAPVILLRELCASSSPHFSQQSPTIFHHLMKDRFTSISAVRLPHGSTAPASSEDKAAFSIVPHRVYGVQRTLPRASKATSTLGRDKPRSLATIYITQPSLSGAERQHE